jgi:hypothetical protein
VTAGVPKGEMAEQVADAIVAVKQIVERRCLSADDCAVQSTTVRAYETRGVFEWAKASAQTTHPVPEEYRTPAAQIYTGSLNGFDEEDFLAMTRSAYKQRKGPTQWDAFLGIDLKGKVSNWSRYDDTVANKTAVRQFLNDPESKALINVIDRYVCDAGEINLHCSSFLYTDANTGDDTAYTHRSGIILDMEYAGLAYTRLPNYKPLDNKGGGPRGIVDAIFIHMIDNPLHLMAAKISSDN